MKYSFLLVIFCLLQSYSSNSQIAGVDVFINEFHYDNNGTDAGEFIEIAGPAGVDLATFTLTLYNGTGGLTYSSPILSGIIPDAGDGYGTLCFYIPGIQNGSPDGIALSDATANIMFISYEGSFIAADGPAIGMTSTDILVAQSGTTPIGESLQLIGVGTTYSSFTWSGPAAESPCSENSGQGIYYTCETFAFVTATACDSYTSPSGNYTWTTSGIYLDTIPNVALCDSIISTNLTINYETTSTINETVCETYTSPSGNYTWTTSGMYNDTIPNVALCDSVITINLVVNYATTSSIVENACVSYSSPSGNYTWTSSGTYFDTIPNANMCDSVITIDLTINQLPVVTYTNPVSSLCDYENSFALTGGSPAGGVYTGTGVAGGVFDPSVSGIGTFTLNYSYTDGNGCENNANSAITVDDCAGLEEIENNYYVYPNPTSDYILIDGEVTEDIDVNLLDLQGKSVDITEIQKENKIIDVRNVTPGIYLLVIISNEHTFTTTVVIQ